MRIESQLLSISYVESIRFPRQRDCDGAYSTGRLSREIEPSCVHSPVPNPPASWRKEMVKALISQLGAGKNYWHDLWRYRELFYFPGLWSAKPLAAIRESKPACGNETGML